jgi:cell division transport system permease protein
LSNVAFAVALVQAVGAILLIANMVQVAAYTRRTEIGIMRLVGASRWYTQLPFLVEAMVAAAIGVAIAVAGLILVRATFLDNALNQFYQANLIARVDYADILYIAPWLFLLGVSMAGLTAYATLRLYVRR